MKKYFTLFFILFLMIGCSSPVTEMTLTADATRNAEGFYEIPADGESEVKITAKILIDDKKPADGQTVTFTTTLGSFSNTKTTITDKTESGKAEVVLYSATKIDIATVTATFTDKTSKKTFTKTIKIKFGDLINKVSAKNFSITCESKNAGFLYDKNAIIECFILSQDRKGELVPIPNISFLTEAGIFEIIQDGSLTRYFYKLDNKNPLDVEPNETIGEVSRFDNLGKTKNPRDGLVTIIAIVNGEEAFNDTNSNGERDNGELAIDLPEPFVDSNDDGEYTQGEYYIDTNANNQWDYGNGEWDENTTIFTQTKILFTGKNEDVEDATRFEMAQTPINIETGFGQPLSCGDITGIIVDFYLLDENLNPIAANETDISTLQIKVTGWKTESVTITKNLPDTYGMDFDTKGRVLYIDQEENKKFTFIIRSTASADDCTGYENNDFYDVTVTLKTYPAKENTQYKDRIKLEKIWTFKGQILGGGAK